MRHTTDQTTDTGSRAIGVGMVVILVLAGWVLRLEQFTAQVLLDDEWHAVHQLLAGRTPAELFRTFGHADYSIPLGLLYGLESRLFGLSELAMRWPMLLSGLLTLPLFAAWAWKRTTPLATVVFTGLLALSPLLLLYSRVARPYAITLLLSWVALYAFYRWFTAAHDGIRWGVFYALAAALCAWLHPVTGPFLVAPFVLEGVRALWRRQIGTIGRLLALGLPTATVMAALLLPPLLADAASLAVKAGAAEFSLATLEGVGFHLFGARSGALVVFLGLLAGIGLPGLLRLGPPLGAGLLGVGLTGLAIVISQPAWAQHSLTLTRYLLPLLPLVLLSAALGVDRICRLGREWGPLFAGITGMVLAMLAVAYIMSSPLRGLVIEADNQANHSIYPFEFRTEHQAIRAYQREHLPRTAFWDEAGATGGATGVIAVAPFWFETHNWDAPYWHGRSGQRIQPLMVSSLCDLDRRGEVPRDRRFRFSNLLYADDVLGPTPKADWLVLMKPFQGFTTRGDGAPIGALEYAACRPVLIAQLGQPDYEDESLLAFRLGPNMR